MLYRGCRRCIGNKRQDNMRRDINDDVYLIVCIFDQNNNILFFLNNIKKKCKGTEMKPDT